MRLLQLHIDQFGPWANLTLDLPGDFATFYGPNEAGKSSLMKFVRGVLFGFKPTHPDAGGSLTVELDGTERTLARESDGGRGHLSIDGIGEGAAADRWLAEQLGGVGEDLFVSIFAIGLEDMQQLAALDRDEIADSIYGLSLGPEGERLTAAASLLSAGRQTLLADDSGQGRLTRLLRRRTEADAELAKLPSAWERFDRLADDIESVRREVVRLETERDGLRQQVRGLGLLEQAHRPWQRQRELQSELSRLGSFASLGRPDASSKLDELAEQITRFAAERKRLKGDDARLKREYGELSAEPAMATYSCRIDALLEEEPAIREQRDRLKTLRAQRSEAHRRQEAAARSTPDIQAMRAGFTVTPGGHGGADLYREADAYKSAKRRLKRLQSKYDASTKLQTRQTEQLKTALGDHAGVEQAREAINRELKRLDSLHTLVQKERLLEARQRLLRQSPSGSWASVLPDFIYPVLWFFAIAGLILFFTGAYRGVVDAWVLGACYAFAGLSFLGIAWTLGRIGGAGAEGGYIDMLRETEHRLKDTRRELDRLDPPSRPAQVYRGQSIAAVSAVRAGIDDGIAALRTRLLDLDRVEERDRSNRRLREKLTQTRQLIRTERQRVSDARQVWLRTLRAHGLTETLKTGEALESWQRQSRSLSTDEWDSIEQAQAAAIQDAVEGTLAQAEVEKADALCRLAEADLATFDRKLADLAVRLGVPVPSSDPFGWLRRLQQDVAEAERKKKERLTLRGRRKDVQSTLRSIDDRLSRQQREYDGMLAEFGVGSRDELQLRMKEAAQADELRREIETLDAELIDLSGREPGLALTEDAIASFDGTLSGGQLREMESQIAEIERELDEVRETLGRLEAEREELASSRTAARLRFDRDQADAALDDLIVDYVASGLAADAIEEVRVQIEANAQPATLKRAAEYLDQLTVGRYVDLLSDRDERSLAVIDEHGEPWTVETLSTGTREQVFLAIRLAIADEFAADGGRLPLVLDDVLVNFDHDRTEAALQTLADFTEQGQQVLLFTCHKHVAALLAKRDIEAVPMPLRDGLREAA